MKLLDVLNGERTETPPIWMMRQAGRHLPEYLEVRASCKNFIDFCFTPEKAAEVTLQPIRRYDMDAAILFADILLIPIGLGRKVDFIKGTGPVLEPIDADGISKLTVSGAAERINSVWETVERVRAGLPKDKALIGFAGGPWTVATYMIEGKGSPTKEIAKLFDRLVINPTRDIISRVRAAGITVPIMGFPRGAGLNAIRYAHETGITGIAAGTQMPLDDYRATLPDGMPLQGNLDPLALRIGGTTLYRSVEAVLRDAAGGPHIFNLGHGVTPDVKIENVQAVVDHIRGKDPNYV
jgi:uroporphyrinogen decarboxylase